MRISLRYARFVTGCCETAVLVGAIAKRCGAASILLAAEDGKWDERARSLGIDVCRYDGNLEETVSRVTNGRGFDLSFETSGEKEGYAALLEATKRGGTVGILAELKEPYSFFVKTAIRSQIRFMGIRSFDEEAVQSAGNLLRGGGLDAVVSALNS
jgi:threonine dehydrogenase-like Zn-dependent dehydrogenase